MRKGRIIWGITGILLLGMLADLKYNPDGSLSKWFGDTATALLGEADSENRTKGPAFGRVARSGGVSVAEPMADLVVEPGEFEMSAAPAPAGGYVYGTLDDAARQVYDEIYEVLMKHEEKTAMSTLDSELLDRAYKAVCADYGGIFWASGYVYTQYTRGDELIELEFAPQYTMTKEERDVWQEQIDAKVDRIIEEISGEISAEISAETAAGETAVPDDYRKARKVFDYLSSHVDYVVGSPDNQNIISVFLNGETVCQGYACATQYLLAELGIECAVITGEAEGEAHAWNLAKLDGEYYYIDTTWGNSTYTNKESGVSRFINYNYFGVTTWDLMQTHHPNDYFVLPECTAVDDNYYIREGKYFSEWNPDAVGNLYREAYETGNSAVSVRFATKELYERYRAWFISEKHIADYCSGISTLYYVEDRTQNVLTFSFS